MRIWLYNIPAGDGWWLRKGQVRPFSTSSLKRLESSAKGEDVLYERNPHETLLSKSKTPNHSATNDWSLGSELAVSV